MAERVYLKASFRMKIKDGKCLLAHFCERFSQRRRSVEEIQLRQSVNISANTYAQYVEVLHEPSIKWAKENGKRLTQDAGGGGRGACGFLQLLVAAADGLGDFGAALRAEADGEPEEGEDGDPDEDVERQVSHDGVAGEVAVRPVTGILPIATGDVGAELVSHDGVAGEVAVRPVTGILPIATGDVGAELRLGRPPPSCSWFMTGPCGRGGYTAGGAGTTAGCTHGCCCAMAQHGREASEPGTKSQFTSDSWQIGLTGEPRSIDRSSIFGVIGGSLDSGTVDMMRIEGWGCDYGGSGDAVGAVRLSCESRMRLRGSASRPSQCPTAGLEKRSARGDDDAGRAAGIKFYCYAWEGIVWTLAMSLAVTCQQQSSPLAIRCNAAL
uniref:Uncharacterized protein n=1 Tax=Oryza brachyantha TaxID=4533 RepID=J3LM48_ORYBR